MIRQLFLYLSLLFLCLLVACGTLQQTPIEDVDLSVTSFAADENRFSISIKNNGTFSAGTFEVVVTMDEIYLEKPGSKCVTLEGLPAGATATLEIINNLSSCEGKGEHYAAVKVDSNFQLSESNEENNFKNVYYYNGDYPAEYNAMCAGLPSWITNVKNKLNLDYDFPCVGNVYLRLVDDLGDISGSMGAPHLFGSNEATPVLSFSLKRLHDGYATYESGGVIYISDTSEEVIYHEYIHAYHWYYVSVNQGEWPPSWFKEGFAVYNAGHGLKTAKRLIARCKQKGKTLSETIGMILDGMDRNEQHESYDYAEDYLAFQYIVDNYGQAALKKIVHDNSFGCSIEAAVVDNLSGINNWTDFGSSAYSCGRASIEAIYPLVN